MSGTRSHWEDVYASKDETAVSWYQPRSARSLVLIGAAASRKNLAVVDVGGGASTLVDGLLASGYSDLTVLDVTDAALAKSKKRLGRNAGHVRWIVADIAQWKPPRAYDVWHDRALFHFLTERSQQEAYIDVLTAGTKLGSTVIMATFALDGPEKCSGLPVQRYSPALLAIRLGNAFRLALDASEVHMTPWGTEQRFTYAVLERVT